MVRNIVFDMGRVLIEFDPVKFFEAIGVCNADIPMLESKTAGSISWMQLDRGSVGHEEAFKAMDETLPDKYKGYPKMLFEGWHKPTPVMISGMTDIVKALKGNGYGIYLLSNAATNLPEYFPLTPVFKFFDGIFYSAEAKRLKPGLEIYRMFFERFSLNPSECLFIDDKKENVEASIFSGMDAIVFTGSESLKWELAKRGVPLTL